uniref:Ribosome biogenesis protein NOP53 n=1 Tax=Trichuris muris TaxID=70415 RepID=A0A5S6R503_TRIMR
MARKRTSYGAGVSGSTKKENYDEQPVPRSTANLLRHLSERKVRKKSKSKLRLQPRSNESRFSFLRRVDEITQEVVLRELAKIDFTDPSVRTERNGKRRKRCSSLFTRILNGKKPDRKRKGRFVAKGKF